MEKVEEIKKEIGVIKSSLFLIAPFYHSIIARARIYVTEAPITAGVTDKDELFIGMDFWNILSTQEKMWVLSHEASHLAFRDHKRVGRRDLKTWNLVSDAVNNNIIECFHFEISDEMKYRFCVRLQDLPIPNIPLSELEQKTKEELYALLQNINLSIPSVTLYQVDIGYQVAEEKNGIGSGDGKEKEENGDKEGDGSKEGSSGKEGSGGKEGSNNKEDESNAAHKGGYKKYLVQSGDENAYKDEPEEEKENKWKQYVSIAYTTQKSIGTVPGELEIYIKQFLEPKISWRSLLKASLKEGVGRSVVETWKKPSRKSSDLPGIKKISTPTIWTLVDTSASISDSELSQFLSELRAMTTVSNVKLIPWDTKTYGIFDLRNASDVISVANGKLKGRGGTCIKEAATLVAKKMKLRDAVIILSDFYIYDLDTPEVKELLNVIKTRSSVAIALTSGAKNFELGGWKKISIL